jgi:ribose transport system substrate-binding protein
MSLTRSFRRALVALSAAAILVAGCDSGTTSTTPTGTAPGGGAIDPAKALADAKASTEAALKGTNRPVDPTSRAAVPGKKLAVITTSMAVSSSKVPAQAAEEAGKALGWEATVYDGELQPAKWPGLVRQATAAGADAIVLVAIDCKDVKQPLEEAKAKNIAITSIYSFDCNDPRADPKNVGEPLFTANTNFGPKAGDIAAFTKSYGADQANYIIADSDNQAKVIEIIAPEFTVLNYTHDGFKEKIDQSGGAEIVSTIEGFQAELLNGQLQSKIQAELLKHPEATWIKSPFTFVTTFALVPALSGREIKAMGGEGFVEELTLIHEGKVTAVNVISSEWNGWAAVDTLNSVFRKEKSADSGIGWTIVDKDHGLPPQGDAFTPPVDFRAAYRKAWGTS